MKRTILPCLLSCLLTVIVLGTVLVVGAGCFVGDYMVHFGLERGTADNPKEPPKAYALLIPPDARTFSRPDFPSEPWMITSRDGLKLTATHFFPQAPSERWVILAHGYGCTQENSWYLATHFLSLGYNVLTPDLRASGDSEGRYLTMGYREGDDVVRWAQRIVREDSSAKIVLAGVSMGAATVMMASAADDLPKNVVACVEDSGYTSAYQLLALQVEDSFGLPSFPAMNLIDWRCRKKVGFSLKDAEPLEAVRKAKIPMLFIHGSKDTLVPSYMEDMLYEAKQGRKEILLIEGARHGAGSQKDARRYFSTIDRFVREAIDS